MEIVDVRVLALALLLVALVVGRLAASGEQAPDARLLLDLDLLLQAEPQERDLVRRLSLVERLRLLELFRMLEAPPAVPAQQRAPAGSGSR